MNPLQIQINKSGYTIHNAVQKQDIVSNIKRMDDALAIYRKLTAPAHQTQHLDSDWIVAPGFLTTK